MSGFDRRRIFRIVSFQASHRVMLLRSDPEPKIDAHTRIEVYFGHVEMVFIRSVMTGLSIRQALHEEFESCVARFGVEARPGSIFLVNSSEGEGFVVSGRPAWREAVREFHEPTLFDFSSPWEGGPPPGLLFGNF